MLSYVGVNCCEEEERRAPSFMNKKDLCKNKSACVGFCVGCR